MNEAAEIQQTLEFYKDPQNAKAIWNEYSPEFHRYGVESEALNILERTHDSARLDILLDELVTNAELRNTAKSNVEYPAEEEAYTYRNLPSSCAKPIVLYDEAKKSKLNAKFWNRNHAEELHKKRDAKKSGMRYDSTVSQFGRNLILMF